MVFYGRKIVRTELAVLGWVYLYLAVDASGGFGDAQCLVFWIKVIPEEGHQLAHRMPVVSSR